MRYRVLLLALFAVIAATAQTEPLFDKEYYRCENQWVLLPKKAADTAYTTAYLYLDRDAGFSLRLQGSLYKDRGGIWRYSAYDRKSATIFRIPAEFTNVAVMDLQTLAAAGLPTAPDWIWNYREGEDDAPQLVRRGYFYNHVGASDIALPLLEKAYKEDPETEQLMFELSYAYNALGKFDDAISLLLPAVKKTPKEPMLLRELGYAYAQQLKMDDAEAVYKKGIACSTKPDQQAEMAFNMVGAYFKKGNKEKFAEWGGILKKYAEKDSVFISYYMLFEEALNKK